MPDDEDSLWVDVVSGRNIVDHRVQVGDVVDDAREEIATRVVGVPEAVVLQIERPIRIGIEKRLLVGDGAELKVALLADAGDCVTVKVNYQGSRVVSVVPRG